MSTQYTVVAGPDLNRIVSRLTDGSSCGAGDEKQRPVTFKITDGQQEWEEQVRLLGMSREDGSGKNWMLDGYTIANSARVTMFYSLHNRKGWLKFEK